MSTEVKDLHNGPDYGTPLFDLNKDPKDLDEEGKKLRSQEIARRNKIKGEYDAAVEQLSEWISTVIDSFEVIGFDPSASKNYCSGITKEWRIVLGLIAFFLGRITQKKLDVRPILNELKNSEGKGVVAWINSTFSSGKTVTCNSDSGKPFNLNFSHVATMCLIMESDTIRHHRVFETKTADFFCNSSLLVAGDKGVNMWSYESYAYFAISDPEFTSCIAHMYWRMATTKGYLAPQVSVSLKIRKYVSEYHDQSSSVKISDVIARYDELCKETKVEPKIPFQTLQKILEPSSGKRNDDLNVTAAKNAGLRQLAQAAMEVIKSANKKAKGLKKKKKAEEGEEDDQEE